MSDASSETNTPESPHLQNRVVRNMFSFYITSSEEEDNHIDSLYSTGFIVNDHVVNNDDIDNDLNLSEDILSSSSSASNKSPINEINIPSQTSNHTSRNVVEPDILYSSIESTTNNECIICLEQGKLSDNYLCDCEFKYHPACYAEWLFKKKTNICLLCNREIVSMSCVYYQPYLNYVL